MKKRDTNNINPQNYRPHPSGVEAIHVNKHQKPQQYVKIT
jgi:hypothetical protein